MTGASENGLGVSDTCHADTCQYEARDCCQSDARHGCQAEPRQSDSCQRAFVVLDLQDSCEAKRHKKFKLCKHFPFKTNYESVNDECISDTRFRKKGQIVSRSCQTDPLPDHVVWMLDEYVDRPIFVRRKSTKRDKHRKEVSKVTENLETSNCKTPEVSVPSDLCKNFTEKPHTSGTIIEDGTMSNESCQTSFIDTRVTIGQYETLNVKFGPSTPHAGPSDRCQNSPFDRALTYNRKTKDSRDSDRNEDQAPFAIYDGKIDIPIRF